MFFFFFQAEDGIRDKLVTGVQTCALPICYSTDASIYQIEPIGVALPRDTADVEAAIGIAREEGFPVLPRGAGSSRSEEHTSELQSLAYLVCRLLLEKKKKQSGTVPFCAQ